MTRRLTYCPRCGNAGVLSATCGVCGADKREAPRSDDPNAYGIKFVSDRGNADGSVARDLITTYARPIKLRDALAKEIQRAQRGNARVLRIEIAPDDA
jgi:hypothetical protein